MAGLTGQRIRRTDFLFPHGACSNGGVPSRSRRFKCAALCTSPGCGGKGPLHFPQCGVRRCVSSPRSWTGRRRQLAEENGGLGGGSQRHSGRHQGAVGFSASEAEQTNGFEGYSKDCRSAGPIAGNSGSFHCNSGSTGWHFPRGSGRDSSLAWHSSVWQERKASSQCSSAGRFQRRRRRPGRHSWWWRRFWICRPGGKCIGEADRNCGSHGGGEGQQEERPRPDPGPRRIWIGQHGGFHEKQIWSPANPATAPYKRSKTHLSVFGEASSRGLGVGRISTGRVGQHHHGPGVAGAPEQNPGLSFGHSAGLDYSWYMGQPTSKQGGGGPGSGRVGPGDVRSAGMRCRELDDSGGDRPRAGSSVPFIPKPLSPQQLGDTPHEVGGQQVLRSCGLKAEGFGRVSREEIKAGTAKGSSGGRGSSKGCSKEGGKRKRKAEGAGFSSLCPMTLHDDLASPEEDGCAAFEAPPGDHFAAVHVPGSAAPTLEIETLWMALTRWVLRSKGPFASFLQTYISNSPVAEAGTASQIWPIPAPYPEFLVPGLRLRRTTCKVGSRRRAVNLAVLALSWLHLGSPSKCPAGFACGQKLSAKQQAAVRHLESHYRDVQIGEVGPAEMGRSAARVESLVDFLVQLHGEVEKLLPHSYREKFSFGSSEKSSKLKAGHREGDAGSVVGKLASGVPALAKEVDPARLSLPKSDPTFDPGPLLTEPHSTVYSDPISTARAPVPEDRPPRVRVHGSKSRAMGLLRLLDERNRLRLAPEKKVRKSHLCGCFALIKDSEKDRMILDARPPNELEVTLQSWCKTLASLQSLSQLELLPGCSMFFSGTDLRDYYYSFRVSQRRSHRNAFNLPLTADQARQFRCFNKSLDNSSTIYPCLSTLAMGDNQAVELGQRAHVALGLVARAFSPFELLSVHGKPPRGAIAAGVVIDDFIVCEQIPDIEDRTSYSEGTARLDRICEEYCQRGLEAHPKKTFRKQETAEFWGGLCDGRSGRIRPNPKRLIPLLELTSKTARLGFCTVSLLEVLSGAWVSILQSRRRMMCLLDEVYQAQRGRERSSIIKMSLNLICELWLLCILGPLAASDMRASSIPELYLTDASDWGTAAVKADIPWNLSFEFQRHTLQRGSWSRLLSPWKSWLKLHGDLEEEQELPSGVPLVSHPLWVELAQCLEFRLHHRKRVRKKEHINISELKAILEVEASLAKRLMKIRYLLGSDSQVALATLVKGRSASPSLNRLLRSSLATILGAGLVGNYNYVPSLVNVGDDPTRGAPIRPPAKPLPDWWESAMNGDFTLFDQWLEELGYDPLKLADLPFSDGRAVNWERISKEFLPELRSVQKPDRLLRFDAEHVSHPERSSRPSRRVVELADHLVSPLESQEENKKTREQRNEPEGQTKTLEKSQKDPMMERPLGKAVVSNQRVAPPENHVVKFKADGRQRTIGLEGDDAWLTTLTSGDLWSENPAAALLSKEASQLLAEFPSLQFVPPGGGRRSQKFSPKRQGFLDLFSGKCGVAKELSKKCNVWTLTFDYEHGGEQDLLNPELQDRLEALVRSGAFMGVGAAPECCSFSRAVVPPWRSAEYPEGFPGLYPRAAEKVTRGNNMASFVLRLILVALELKLYYWVENPDSSFMWMLPGWVRHGLGRFDACFRFDQCRFHTPWRKRTRIATNTKLRGLRELCRGGHSHIQLRGRSALHRMNWTRVAQEYPKSLCKRLADAMGQSCGLLGKPSKPSHSFSLHGCSKCSHPRIGEAKNPGPRRWTHTGKRRDPQELLDVKMVDAGTQLLQEKVWKKFLEWIHEHLSEEAASQIFLAPALGAQILKRYGLFLFEAGRALYELRHLLVVVQQQFPLMRAAMAPAWSMVNRWEEIQPVRHRPPLPEVLYKAMVVTALFWHWNRFASCLVLGMEGIARIGEIMQALRMDLVLPEDLFDPVARFAFLKVRKPKTKRRGRGRVQHLKIENAGAVRFLSENFGHLDDSLKLFPLSASAFRTRWEKILNFLQLPRHLRPSPASIRGGGAVMAYRKGESIPSILWRMRLLNQATLESYLQELAADSMLVQLPETSKSRIRFMASFFTRAMPPCWSKHCTSIAYQRWRPLQ